jgi:hypothetical protein
VSIRRNDDILRIALKSSTAALHSSQGATAVLASLSLVGFPRHFFASNKEKNDAMLASDCSVYSRYSLVIAGTHDQQRPHRYFEDIRR